MRPYQQLTAAIFAAIGLFVAAEGYSLKLQGDFGPGPGFMAFLVGASLCAVSLLWLVAVSARSSQAFAAEALPEPGGGTKVVAILVAALAFAALLTVIGFKLSMFLFLVAAFLIFGRDRLLTKAISAVVGSFGLDYAFERLLRVSLPDASIESLSALGF